MKKLLLLTGLVISWAASAQNYTRDVGIRIGDHFSATYRQNIDDQQALEGMLFIGRRGMTFTVLKEHFQPAFGHISEHLYFLYGYGAHVGFRYIDHYDVLWRTYNLEKFRFTPLLGLDGLIGLEYHFPEFPIMIGLDAKPYFEYSTIQIFSIYLQSIGFTMKYRF